MHSPTKRQRAASVGAAGAADKEKEVEERIESSMNELVKLSDEKLNIATQVRCVGAAGVACSRTACAALSC